MDKVSALFATVLFVSTTLAAPNTCKQGNVVHKPNSNTTNYYYWPSTWRENTTAPHLAAGQDCSWTVTVPKGYYAKLIMDGKVADKDSRFQTVDTVGNVIQTTHEKQQPYYFPSVKFTLIVSTEGAATFGFKIVWSPLPTHGFNTGIGTMPNLYNATNSVYSNQIGSSSPLSVLVFPQDIHNTHTLRSALLFEGNREDPSYVSSLEAVFKTGKQYISTISEILVVNVEASSSQDYVLFQQHAYLQNYHPYKALQCNPNSNCIVTVDGGNKQSAVVTVPHGNETLVDVQMDPTANFSIYYGTPSPFAFDRVYTGAELKSVLPIFCAYVETFVISSGKAVFTFLT